MTFRVLPTARPRALLKLAALAATVMAGFMMVQPPEASAATQSITVAPRHFKMPKGDHVMGPIHFQKAPRRIPIGNAALKAIKAGPAADAEMTTIDGASASPSGRSFAARCTTNSSVGFAPSDVHGAASRTHIVVVTNVEVGVYTTGCVLVSKVSLKTFFGAPVAETLFDPRVIFDKRSGRFFISAESEQSANTDQTQYFGVSTSSTATAWTTYPLILSKVSTGALFCKAAQGSFWDYPQIGVSSNRMYMTANDFGASVVGAILDIDKAPMLVGAGTGVRCFNALQFNLAPPYVLDLSTNAVFIAPGSGGGSTITRRDLSSAGAIATDTLTARPSFAIAAWTAAPDPTQPNGVALDGLDGRFQSYSTQSRGLLWNIHTVGVGSPAAAKIRWYRLNATSTASSTVLNTATLQTAATDRLFNPSIITASGLPGAPAYIDASRTIPSVASGHAAHIIMWGLNNDSTAANWTAQNMFQSTTDFASCGSPCRWGDYSSIQVDPSNDGVAWGFNQNTAGTSQFSWGTTAVKVFLTLPARPE